MKKIETVSIIGLGAIGAAFLAEASPNMEYSDLRVIAGGTRGAKLRADGIAVNGEVLRPRIIDPDEDAGVSDLLIFAVKFGQLADAIENARRFVGERTVILSLLNGISSENIIGERFGADKLLYSYAVGTDAGNTGSARSYTRMFTIPFGEKTNTPGQYSENVLAVDEFLSRVGIPHEVPEDMLKSLWWKYMMNMGVNQSLGVTRLPYRAIQRGGIVRKLARDIMLEAITVANAEGVTLTETDADAALAVIDTIGAEGKPSTLQDIEARRVTEIEIFSGDLLRLGKKHGLALPINETLYTIIKGIEESLL
jgi:2-dehydropantoate 2-reductase